jgi:hypothetical protein
MAGFSKANGGRRLLTVPDQSSGSLKTHKPARTSMPGGRHSTRSGQLLLQSPVWGEVECPETALASIQVTTTGGTMVQGPERTQPVSGWAVGGITFAATLMVMIGLFHVITGLVAIFNDEFFVVARGYTFDLDTTAWGWIHLILGILLLVAGFGLFARTTWAGVTAIFLAVLSAVDNFFFIPYYPFWSLLLIALDVWVIWALTRPSAIRT